MNISFIIPFHNEEDNVSFMLDRVIDFKIKHKWKIEIIPVDDRSTDGTNKILLQYQKKFPFVKPVIRKIDQEEKGNTMGKALIEGTKNASNEIIIWTMGDLTDDTKTYSKIASKVKEGYDLVFGSRYMAGGSSGNLDKIKAFLSSLGTKFARLIFHIPVHDITNAFRGFKKEVFYRLILTSSGFSISPEFALKAHLAGYSLGEVPTVYTNRVKGISNFKLYKMSISYLKLYLQLYIKYKLFQFPIDFLKDKTN